VTNVWVAQPAFCVPAAETNAGESTVLQECGAMTKIFHDSMIVIVSITHKIIKLENINQVRIKPMNSCL
jgi:hypothetical protein